MSSEALHDRICDALCGNWPRLVAEMFGPDGEPDLIVDDGTVKAMLRKDSGWK
ncbi:MAG: hypothetical protein QOC81_844 [Thermoanaerobaculia bacterium]|jgi:hypothetical protein|nr:hypothetical protein [Thermoanaerobaculia bacterium]